ncbi:hypothetical protein A4X06_0g761 [Tilletia controversa]|uniref:ERCC4 domain-containing protein n=1 Tax=Tilletia controversa TaxID=13291 RepID=A0A8X7SZV4_9BASI|nr:hypothetical protein CF328_g707 [Tilletia controversa]KAE8254737.1 hypothetical protein A4X06_0g761 [Tilletia controversa]
MEDRGIPSSSPVQAFSSSGHLPIAGRTSASRLATSTRADSAPSSSRTGINRPMLATASRSQGSSLLDALNSHSASQSRAIASQVDDEPPNKRRRKEAAEQQQQQAALKSAKKAEERISKEVEKNRKKAEKASIMATKKDWTDANKLRKSKTETFTEMVVDVDGALTAPASAPSTNPTNDPIQPSFAGALHGSGITALQTRLHEEGATVHILGSSEPRGASSTNPLSTALGIATPLPDLPVIRLRRKIKARLDVEHRIWVPLGSATMQHEPTAIIMLSAAEVLAHLARGEGALAQMIPRVKANLASGGGVQQSQAFQLFFVVVGLQMHFRKVAQKNDQDWRKAVQTSLARRTEGEGIVETGAGAGASTSTSTSTARKRKGQVAETFPQVDQEQAELELLRLTMEHGVYVIHAKALVDAVEAVVDVVGEVGIRPYKMVANSHLPFCTDASRTRTVATDEDTYMSMLQQIPRVTEPAARAIQEEFPTMRSLMEAYDAALVEDDRRTGSKKASRTDDLLADCMIRNRKDGQASSRRVGPALSKRIGFVLTHDDPLALV